jgi:oxygen-independent coproporphyrinogen-3 oxidase
MPQLEPATSKLDLEATEVGSVFVSNYPPYSFWSTEQLASVEEALDSAPLPGADLGLYLHIPFCRRRCKFCYFRVYTDKNSEQIERYLDALCSEVDALAERRAVSGRPLRFVYFGGGTPSYLAVKQLLPLVEHLQSRLPWDAAEEIAFECEPGTLTRPKLEALREIGVSRLSLGVENFNDAILEENGRAHVSTEIYRIEPWIKELDFPQVNIDLIAGMVGETWETWRETVRRAVEFDADSVTIYQLELPFNTVYSKAKLEGDADLGFADWRTKREWHAYAIEELEAAGYETWSAYTMVKKSPRHGERLKFVYTEALWQGADMIGAGVSSFSHMSGVHYQNLDRFGEYVERVESGRLPINRAFVTSVHERLVRELILQLKTGRLRRRYFEEKFGTDVLEQFSDAFERLSERELATVSDEGVELTPPGLLRVDQLLPSFYDARYRDARYT